MTTLLVAEHSNSDLNEATAKALTAAVEMGGDVHVLVAGKDCGAAAEAASKLSGVAKVLVADDAAYEHQLAEPVGDLIVALAGSYDAIVAAATTNGKNTLPRVAAKLDVMQISEIIAVESADTFKRPIYAGNAIQTVQSADAKKVLTVRTASFAATAEGGSAPVEAAAASADPAISSFVGEEIAASDRPELAGAKIIISGGRALGSEEKFNEVITLLLTSSAQRLVLPVPLLTLVTHQTIGRLARQVRLLHQIFTSLAASRVQSSTLQV